MSDGQKPRKHTAQWILDADWTMENCDIAKIAGVSRQRVFTARKCFTDPIRGAGPQAMSIKELQVIVDAYHAADRSMGRTAEKLGINLGKVKNRLHEAVSRGLKVNIRPPGSRPGENWTDE